MAKLTNKELDQKMNTLPSHAMSEILAKSDARDSATKKRRRRSLDTSYRVRSERVGLPSPTPFPTRQSLDQMEVDTTPSVLERQPRENTEFDDVQTFLRKYGPFAKRRFPRSEQEMEDTFEVEHALRKTKNKFSYPKPLNKKVTTYLSPFRVGGSIRIQLAPKATTLVLRGFTTIE
ncbi:hypothetical protein HK100_004220 [Physocladia obscura]|uniref:Uncharacterized protein n=1 Tax=Physocladia obscura TaxID=109957 RepID=A0AAD5T8W0_9FUNG|nr:hypothetical protein HK100_004220 [Physocladia obscura]